MIENYDEIMSQWASPSVGCCTDMVEIHPDCDLTRWAVQKTVTVLANADYYYTKDEIDYLLEQITKDGVTREEVEQMIQRAIASKANQSDLEALSAQVASNTEDILNRPTTQQVNSLLEQYLKKVNAIEMFKNYSKVNGNVLVLNSENIGS